jgi:hypothetical protein
VSPATILQHAAIALAMQLIPVVALALECPVPPVQANKDWNSQVKAEVGKIGPVTGARLETRVRNTTHDLMGKLPNADRVYLEQMMFSAYCTALRGDKALSESAKAKQILNYRRELNRSLASGKGANSKQPGH